jgi:ribonuclease BN (tRNA processing enzyme)
MKIEYLQNGEPLKLINDGKLEVVPLGVGSMLSTNFYNTNYLIIKGDTHVLVDAGFTTTNALRAVGLKAADIKVVLPTHQHDDHVGGIGCLAIANRYIGKQKLTLLAPRDFAGKLWEENLRGGLAKNERDANGKDLEANDWFKLVCPQIVSFEHRETAVYEFGGISIRTFRVMHVPADAKSWRDSAWGIGLLVDERVFISGDTRFDEELLDTYAPQSEFMFHDVTFTGDPVHASLEELRTLPSKVKQKMSLVHFGDNAPSYDVSEFSGLTKQGARYVFD